MNITAVCISKSPVEWELDIPFVCHVEQFQGYGRTIDKNRITHLVTRRNSTVKEALEQYPDTTDVLMVDNYYVHQISPLKILLQHYRDCAFAHVRGGAIWYWAKGGIIRRARFYDTWAVPDGGSWLLRSPRGIRQVHSVGGVYVFPVKLWESHPYHTSDPIMLDHTSMLHETSIPILLDYDARFWRTPGDSDVKWNTWPDRIRTSVDRWKKRVM